MNQVLINQDKLNDSAMAFMEMFSDLAQYHFFIDKELVKVAMREALYRGIAKQESLADDLYRIVFEDGFKSMYEAELPSDDLSELADDFNQNLVWYVRSESLNHFQICFVEFFSLAYGLSYKNAEIYSYTSDDIVVVTDLDCEEYLYEYIENRVAQDVKEGRHHNYNRATIAILKDMGIDPFNS
ncbi:hypothetical protein CQA49_00795 [Helicobacter sp. MIT 00-7814]|uniref:hypothetical protein n=1 Tax=unclassified Helicobacter TaxID=2593540 RepID=UPI000E1F26A8|nr:MULTISPECIES: hypothetical protein [unclassified Helicobacter]RDU51420.1 hypothetical protein CQA37_09725 [Helicobacter sp. MIT 99-10781]RDU56871.1 hypothetical protein CQA49_00795 [Helicobacter sp. MIT 00-7814]